MKKVLLAIGYRKLEEFIKSRLEDDFSFVGTIVYKEGIIKAIDHKNPDIVVIRETLSGKEDIMNIVYRIRMSYPNIRIVFIAGNRKVGDNLLASLVNYGVYDILYGINIQAREIISLIKDGNTYTNVRHLQHAPDLSEEEREVVFKSREAEGEKNQESDKSSNVDKRDEGDIKDNSLINNIKRDRVEEEVVQELNSSQTEDKPLRENKVKQDPKKEVDERKKVGREGFFSGFRSTLRKVGGGKDKDIANERIITFIGGKSGIGTSSVAVNVAFLLAKKDFKTIYIELNDKNPSVSYWYELGYNSKGIETCLEDMGKGEYSNINNSIVKSREIKKLGEGMKRNYKKFPDALDFMFYSKRHIAGLSSEIKSAEFKELYLYLMYQAGYDYVIIDAPPDVDNKAVQSAVMYSNKIFSVISQDISSIGYYLFNLNILEEKGVNLLSKNKFIINRYEESRFGKKDVKRWLDADKVLVIPSCNKEFIDANFEGLPIVISSRDSSLLASIENLVSVVMKK